MVDGRLKSSLKDVTPGVNSRKDHSECVTAFIIAGDVFKGFEQAANVSDCISVVALAVMDYSLWLSWPRRKYIG